MRSRFVLLVTVVLAIGLLVVGCSQASTPAPTAAPAASKAAEPTKAAAPAAEPTKPAAATPAAAKVNFPEKGKSITFNIPWAAGGPTDVGGRLLAGGLEKELGVPVQVVNKAGAGSQVGITELAKAKPDGYYVGMTNLPSSITPDMPATPSSG
ncbi:MAG TPA: tripartite tricarboxylate transporter substrate-binding protein [Chloroflexota bacterium]|nr:tripartite tricarboxylate transporter substrate-binding protein [Chloroflexota bacterium]